MDIGDLSFFLAVARAGGISRASKELLTVQSNISSRIRRSRTNSEWNCFAAMRAE